MEQKEKTKEIWKDVPGYEGYYQASNLGRVRSLDRTIIDKNGCSKFYKKKVIVGSYNKGGYRQTSLRHMIRPAYFDCKPNKIKCIFIAIFTHFER